MAGTRRLTRARRPKRRAAGWLATPAADAARWLVEFTDTDLSDDARLREAADGALRFVSFDIRTHDARPWTGGHTADTDEGLWLRYVRPGIATGAREREGARRFLVKMQQAVQQGWARLQAGEVWRVDLRDVDGTVGRGDGGALLTGIGGSWRSRFLQRAQSLTAQFYDAIRVCALPECNRRFLPRRGNAHACSVAHRRVMLPSRQRRNYAKEWKARQRARRKGRS